MARIGLKNLYYAKITEGTDGTETYGAMKKLAEAVSAEVTPNTASATLFGDDMTVATDTQIKDVGVALESTDITLEDQAALFGHTYADGELIAKGDDEPPYVGIAFEYKTHKGKIRCVKLVKGKFMPAQERTDTKGEQLQYQVETINGTFVMRADGVWKRVKEFAKGESTASWYQTF